MGQREQRVHISNIFATPFALVKMLSRRSLTAFTLITATLLFLLLTTRRLGDLSPHHHRPPPPAGHESQHGDHAGPGQTDGRLNTDIPFRPRDPLCDNFPDTRNILVVMKTGASESFGKIPTQVMTMLKCLPEYFIFSDFAQDVAGYHIRDSLDTVLEEAKAGNKDFDLYRRQQACPIDQENCNKVANSASEGWNLDKYKNVHIAEKTYTMRPNYDWYVFVDADSYVLWPTLVQWLRKLSPTNKHYLGSVTLINNFSFGHGGSGYIVSQAAMSEFIGRNPGVANRWDVRAKDECCGDYIFAMALKNATNVGVHQVWPTINGEKPSTLPYGPTHWCHPIVTMHHMNAEEVSSFWAFETKRYASVSPSSNPPPMLIKDIYHEFFGPKLRQTREDWDNLADDRFYLNASSRQFQDWELNKAKKDGLSEIEQKAHLSFSHCREACESLKDCYSYRWQDGICGVCWAFKHGKPMKREKEEHKRWMSGWDVSKIKNFIEREGDCAKVRWPDV